MPSDLARFYALVEALRSTPGQGRILAEYSGRGWPERGVYFFLEPGETVGSHPADPPRVVRVGTHAISEGSRSSLWGRLRAHRGTTSLSGNHRGSIFRSHVGSALLARDAKTFPTWGSSRSASANARAEEREMEIRVSTHIGQMGVLWVAVPDAPSKASLRATIERNAIALLSAQLKPQHSPSTGWLGLHSTNPLIRGSGLWNLKHVLDAPVSDWLDTFEHAVEFTTSYRSNT
ncbi:MAG: hypothetical protein JWO05_3930 [Gemmatimonadetes bacterium]|nr:hypothetical protein [Gemmatimonadota bacterium]